MLVERGGQFGGGGVLELLEAFGDQVVDDVDGLLRLAAKEALHDRHPVVDLALGEVDLVGD